MEKKVTPKGKQIRLAPGVFSATQKANTCHGLKLQFSSQCNIVKAR